MRRFRQNTKGRGFPPLILAASIAVMVIFIQPDIVNSYEINKLENTDGKSTGIVLTLDQAINLALQANRNIANSRYSAESQQYSADAARSVFDLKLIPTAGFSLTGADDTDSNNLSAGFQLQKKLEYGTTVSLGPQITRSSELTERQYATDIGVKITQPLLRGLGKDIVTDNIQSAESAYKTSLRNMYQTKVNTVLETISSFYDAIRQREILQLYKKMRERLKGHSEIARAKEKVGLATPMDTYRAEIPLKEAEDSMITASEALQDAKDRLKLILALPQNTELDMTVPEAPVFNNMSLDETINTALEKRIEIEQMNQDIAEAERKAAVMKHNILPELNLVIEYGRYAEGDTIGQSAGFDIDRSSATLQVSTDISRTAEKAAYQQSLINIKTLRLNIESRMEEISKQVRRQWLSLKEAVKRMEIRKSQIKQGDEKMALAEVKYAHGMADNFDVIEAEKELQNSRGNLLAAEIEYAIGIYNMKAIMGELVPRD
jgi:outer membrane protein